jgi:hypothetical protein
MPLALALVLTGGQADKKEKDKEPAAPAQFPGPLCSKCKTTGKIENPLFKELNKLEGKATCCSYPIEKDPVGHGLPWLPCKDCRNEAAQKAAQDEFKPLFDGRTAWLADRHKINQTLDTELTHVETKNFLVTMAIERMSVDNKQLNQHEIAHLYADRLEKLYQDFLDRFGLKDEDMIYVRHRVMLFPTQKLSMKAGPIYVGMTSTEACKRLGMDSTFCGWWNKQLNPQDSDLHSYVIHHVSHMLLTMVGGLNYCIWLGHIGSGWLEEGLGHFYEMEWFGAGRTHCTRESSMLADWIHDDWRPWIRKRAVQGDVVDLASLDGKTSDALNAKEHVFSWSFVDYLLNAEDPHKFPEFVKRLKTKEQLSTAMRAVYGFTVAGFNDKWKDYVIKKYLPTR